MKPSTPDARQSQRSSQPAATEPSSSATPPPAGASPAAAQSKSDAKADATPQQADVVNVSPALSPAEALALALSPAQLTAIEKMLSGCTLVASAMAAGITRATLYNWLHRDPRFQAAYNAWQLDAITGAKTKLLAMAGPAVDTVGRAVKTDGRLAFAVLKALGTLDRPTPGSTDYEEVARLMEIERLQKENKLEEEFFVAKHLGFACAGNEPMSAGVAAGKKRKKTS